ncbi:DUF3300 domain-containing protein [Pararhizobium sp. O133]|uniref:DUF3300 domain-containing protein n=1 Tax=Pararhizobium sp. O133 TaxID=3449278 RepID=UPI003F684A93
MIHGSRLAAGLGLMLAFSISTVMPAHVSPAFAQETAAADASAADDTTEPLTDEELEVLVARIALYPDELVALVTSASLYPLQIIEAQRYLDQLTKKPDLKPKSTWDGSVVSLLNYPQIVKMMSDDLDWTQSLGEALANQQKDVLIAIQQLRDKAVADKIIKTDDKIKVVHENDNVLIQSVSSEKIYVPQYPPEMLYEPDYVPAPIAYYPEPYPSYYLPTATFFAGAVTGAIWASVVDWDDWGVWGGRWNGDVDIDCNNCFNDRDFNGKVNIGDIDWKNVDRDKINFDRNQFNKIDHHAFKNNIKADGRNSFKARASNISNDRVGNISNKPGNISVKDVRNSKIDADRINRDKAAARNKQGNGKAAAAAGKKQGQAANRAANAKPKAKGNVKANRPAAKPKPAGRIDNRPRKPSAIGNVDNGRRTQIQSNRGRQSMGGGNRGGGGRQVHGGGGRKIHHGGGGRGGGGRRR